MGFDWPPRCPVSLPPPYSDIELIEFLGRGTQGEVYLARAGDFRVLPMALVVKFISGDQTAKAVQYDRVSFLEEARRGRLDVKSEHVARTLEVLDLSACGIAGLPPLGQVMEWFPCTLQYLFDDANGPSGFDHAQVIAWARGLALGLMDLHNDGWVHRDIKPANLFLAVPRENRYDGGPASLRGSSLKIGDLGTIGRDTEIARRGIYRDQAGDPYKHPALYPPAPADDPQAFEQRCESRMDIYAAGGVLRDLATLCEGNADWLLDAADLCQEKKGAAPSAAELVMLVSKDWDDQQRAIMNAARIHPEEHRGFIPRDYIRKEAFEHWAATLHDRGGIFAIVGPPGIGKTALLTNWAMDTGQPFGYYFRHRDNVTTPANMATALAAQLKRQYAIAEPTPTEHDALVPHLEATLQAIMLRADAPARLLLFVDGLDESTNAAEAVGYLPRKLPPGVLLIVATRPTAAGREDHILRLRDAGAHRFHFDPGDPHNLDVLVRYFLRELPNILNAEQARELAERAGGVFMIAQSQVRQLRSAVAAVAEANLASYLAETTHWKSLPADERLCESHQRDWERLCKAMATDGESADVLAQLAGLMAAAIAWLTEAQIGSLLRWDEDRQHLNRHWTDEKIRRVLPRMDWFLDRRAGDGAALYQTRHQSIRDFFVSGAGPVPAPALRRLHLACGDYFVAQSKRRPGRPADWDNVQPNGRFFTVQHYLRGLDGLAQHDWQSEHFTALEQAAALLEDLDWLQATLGDESEPSQAR